MILADVVAIIAFVVCLLLGSIVGFGKGLRFLTGGIFGKIISVVICYFLFGIVLNWGFVQDLLGKFIALLQSSENGICKILLTVRIDLIVFAVALFIVVQILRRIIVAVVCGIFEADNLVMRLINRLLGIVLFLAIFAIVILIVFQIIALIGGTEGAFYQNLVGSKFGLDKLFAENPLNAIIQSIKIPDINQPVA